MNKEDYNKLEEWYKKGKFKRIEKLLKKYRVEKIVKAQRFGAGGHRKIIDVDPNQFEYHENGKDGWPKDEMLYFRRDDLW